MPPEDMEITPVDARPLIEQKQVLLLDVREPYEVAGGIIPGAVHIPLGQLPARHPELPRERTVLVYCAHGIRSFQGAYFLRTQGFEGARSISGGIVSWSQSGGEIVRP